MTAGFVFAAVRRHLILICILITLGLALAAGYGRFAPKTYTASGQLLLGTNLRSSVAASDGSQYLSDRMATYGALAETEPVLAPVAQQFHMSTTELATQVSVTVVPSTVVLQLNASANTPAEAVALTQALMDSTARQLPRLDQRSGSPNLLVEPVGAPATPTAPDQAHGMVLPLIGVGGGLLAGVGVSLVWELARVRRQEKDEATESAQPIELPLDLPLELPTDLFEDRSHLTGPSANAVTSQQKRRSVAAGSVRKVAR